MVTRPYAAMLKPIVGGLMIVGMSSGLPAAAPAAKSGARAELRDASGKVVGQATVKQGTGGIRVSVDVRALPAGTHGLHVHTVGACDAPDFTTAGGHWNPSSMMHGAKNPQGPHGGDMPNIVIAANGRGKQAFTLPSGTMDGLFDADGSAIVVHATADDMMTDPSGNSGARIACGVFKRG